MENKLQELTQKLYTVGVEKAKNEAKTILTEAREKADEILKNAQFKADEIIENAKAESAELKKKTESELVLSSRQVIATVKNQVNHLISKDLLLKDIEKSLDDNRFIQSLIEMIVEKWDLDDAQSTNLQIILPENKKADFEKYIKTKINKHLSKGLEVEFEDDFQSGFKISPSDNSYIINFEAKDFDNFFRSYLRSKTAKLLYKET